jgi:hypothetical protein
MGRPITTDLVTNSNASQWKGVTLICSFVLTSHHFVTAMRQIVQETGVREGHRYHVVCPYRTQTIKWTVHSLTPPSISDQRSCSVILYFSSLPPSTSVNLCNMKDNCHSHSNSHDHERPPLCLNTVHTFTHYFSKSIFILFSFLRQDLSGGVFFPSFPAGQLIFVMVKCCVFFAVRTEFLNIIYTSFGFKGVKSIAVLTHVFLWAVG